MSTGITYGLVIAVENYNQPAHFKQVKFATKDAREFIQAIQATAVDGDEIKLLVDASASKTAIEKEIDILCSKATENDRIIFYFSGHGAFENKENYLLPADCYHDDIKLTSVSVNFILGKLNKSLCEKNLLFLDCCHSGFEPGDDTKTIDRKFLADSLVYESKDEEYTLGFASCKSNQVSITHPILKNGVWSHFLIKALNGDGGDIYESGLLFSDKLQSFLNKSTKEFVKKNTVDKKDQVPIVFGNVTDRFVIANLNAIFEEREKAKKVDGTSFVNVSLLHREKGDVKGLPGFKKRSHRVPDNFGARPNEFIQEIGEDIIKEEIDTLSMAIREKLKYKRAELQSGTYKGSGSIATPDFDYSIVISQSHADPSEYVVTRRLENFKNSKIVDNSDFNTIFSDYFDHLVFDLSKKIDVIKLIDRIEALEEGAGIKVEYNPANLNRCTVKIENLEYSINVTESSISFTTTYQTSPENLIIAFKEIQKELLANPQLKLSF